MAKWYYHACNESAGARHMIIEAATKYRQGDAVAICHPGSSWLVSPM